MKTKKIKFMTVGEAIEILRKQNPRHVLEVNYPKGNGRNINQILDIDLTDPNIVTIFVKGS